MEGLRQAIDFFRADIDQFWATEYPAVYGAPYVAPSSFVPYHDVNDAPLCDGNRLRLGNAYYCPSGDFLAWDEHGLMQVLYNDAGDFAVAFVLAHEWGHAIAAHAHANLPATVFGEEQADCFAGAYASWAQAMGHIKDGDLDEAVYALYEARDAPGTPWLDPQAHGAAFDRIRAFSAGYDQGAGLCSNYSLPSPDSTPPVLPPPAP